MQARGGLKRLLEAHLQRELKDAWNVVVLRGGDGPKSRVTDGVIRIREVRSIGQVEHLGAEFNIYALGDRKVLEEREVCMAEAGAEELVHPFASQRAWLLRYKRRGVEVLLEAELLLF